jgi:hypothetical protein
MRLSGVDLFPVMVGVMVWNPKQLGVLWTRSNQEPFRSVRALCPEIVERRHVRLRYER